MLRFFYHAVNWSHFGTLSGSKKDTTFTKPAIPPTRSSTRADKLAEQYLDTGESTRELIALGDTPVLKTKTRSATATHSKPRAITIDKPSKGLVDSAQHLKPGFPLQLLYQHKSYTVDCTVLSPKLKFDNTAQLCKRMVLDNIVLNSEPALATWYHSFHKGSVSGS